MTDFDATEPANYSLPSEVPAPVVASPRPSFRSSVSTIVFWCTIAAFFVTAPVFGGYAAAWVLIGAAVLWAGFAWGSEALDLLREFRARRAGTSRVDTDDTL